VGGTCSAHSAYEKFMRGLCWKTARMGPSGRPRKMFGGYY